MFYLAATASVVLLPGSSFVLCGRFLFCIVYFPFAFLSLFGLAPLTSSNDGFGWLR